jgi:exportin-1
LVETKFFAVQVLHDLIKTRCLQAVLVRWFDGLVRWKALPRDQCDGIKNYIVNYIIAASSDPQSLEVCAFECERLRGNDHNAQANRLILSKLNPVLVDVIKQDWPKHWQVVAPVRRRRVCLTRNNAMQSFVAEIVSASKTNESLASNNLQILMVLR